MIIMRVKYASEKTSILLYISAIACDEGGRNEEENIFYFFLKNALDNLPVKDCFVN